MKLVEWSKFHKGTCERCGGKMLTGEKAVIVKTGKKKGRLTYHSRAYHKNCYKDAHGNPMM